MIDTKGSKMKIYRHKGQATVEYLLIFAVLALITLLSLSTFYSSVRDSAENLFQAAIGRILAE